METRHTQGEWEIKHRPKQKDIVILSSTDPRNKDGKRLILAKIIYEKEVKAGYAQIHPIVEPLKIDARKSRRTKEEAEANAKLIASAPELLNSLLNLKHLATTNEEGEAVSITPQVFKALTEQAIKKATV